MRLRLAPCMFAAPMILLALAGGASAATPQEVSAAIQKARDYLYKHQNKDGNWELVASPNPAGEYADVKGKQWGGLTAITTYALLAAGDDPLKDLARPIKFLKEANLVGIYAIGLRCQVWLLDSDDKTLGPFIERDKKILMAAIHQHHQETQNGFYSYTFDKGPQPVDWYDRSVSQYGVLGMWALEQAHTEVPTSYWQFVDAAWRRAQDNDGGWSYRNDAEGGSTPTMTAAGIATLFITQDYTLGSLADCRGNVANENIERGLAWMDKNIHQALTGNAYGMYGIERIGVASGRKYFRTVDWYQTGADIIVNGQAADGSFGDDVPNTCFALLFLVRGRAPVIMNKVEYYVDSKAGSPTLGNWNERPRDIANFARWMGRDLEHDLNWQIVNLKVGPEELHDAPILYISGNRDLNLSEADCATLRAYAEQGGIILGNADCGNPAFVKSFEKLGKKLFPQYDFREIPSSHVIYANQQFNPVTSKWKQKIKLLGLSNGVRELMLLVPDADLSRAFQGRNDKTRQELYQLGADIFLYAVDKKNLSVKGETYIVKEKPEIQPTRAITLARLQVGPTWDPEPAGWRRMAALMHNQDQVALTVEPTKIDPAALKAAKVAHLTGTAAFTLDAASRKTLKDFVEAGGTLIVDAAGGSADFADAAEVELKAIFAQTPQLLPSSSPVYNLPGSKIESIRFRQYCSRRITGSLRDERIRAITIKDRPAVFFSREDLSAGLVGEQVDGILGYDPASATSLMRNLILFGAFGFPKPPASAPTTQPATGPATAPATPAK